SKTLNVTLYIASHPNQYLLSFPTRRSSDLAARTPGSGPTDLIALAGGEAGVYLFAGAGQAAVTLAAEALNSPVPAGGRLRFGVAVTDTPGGPLAGDLVRDVVGPGGVGATRTLISGGTLGAGATATLVFRLRVPASAPAGPYDATVTALTGGDGFETTFSFEVVGDALASGGAAARASRWRCWTTAASSPRRLRRRPRHWRRRWRPTRCAGRASSATRCPRPAAPPSPSTTSSAAAWRRSATDCTRRARTRSASTPTGSGCRAGSTCSASTPTR